MAYMQWQDRFSVNIVEIDIQHQNLINVINDFHDSMKSGHGKQQIGAILKGLSAYANEHFKTEENYFKMFKYPQSETHKAEHAYFVARMAEFEKEFENRQPGLGIEILSFARDWLEGHLLEVDQKYIPFLKPKGAS